MLSPSAGAARTRRLITSSLSRSWRRFAQLLRTAWQAHRDMLQRNTAYATAMAAVYVAIRYGRGTSTWPAETQSGG